MHAVREVLASDALEYDELFMLFWCFIITTNVRNNWTANDPNFPAKRFLICLPILWLLVKYSIAVWSKNKKIDKLYSIFLYLLNFQNDL